VGVIRPPKKEKSGFAGKTLLPLFSCAYSHFRATPTPSPPPLKGWEWSGSNPEVVAGGAHTRERVQGDGDLLDEAKARKKIAEAEETYAAPRIANAQREVHENA
jgi:hypothetical protein